MPEGHWINKQGAHNQLLPWTPNFVWWYLFSVVKTLSPSQAWCCTQLLTGSGLWILVLSPKLTLVIWPILFLLGASIFPPVLYGSKYLLRIILAAVKCHGIFEWMTLYSSLWTEWWLWPVHTTDLCRRQTGLIQPSYSPNFIPKPHCGLRQRAHQRTEQS